MSFSAAGRNRRKATFRSPCAPAAELLATRTLLSATTMDAEELASCWPAGIQPVAAEGPTGDETAEITDCGESVVSPEYDLEFPEQPQLAVCELLPREITFPQWIVCPLEPGLEVPETVDFGVVTTGESEQSDATEGNGEVECESPWQTETSEQWIGESVPAESIENEQSTEESTDDSDFEDSDSAHDDSEATVPGELLWTEPDPEAINFVRLPWYAECIKSEWGGAASADLQAIEGEVGESVETVSLLGEWTEPMDCGEAEILTEDQPIGTEVESCWNFCSIADPCSPCEERIPPQEPVAWEWSEYSEGTEFADDDQVAEQFEEEVWNTAFPGSAESGTEAESGKWDWTSDDLNLESEWVGIRPYARGSSQEVVRNPTSSTEVGEILPYGPLLRSLDRTQLLTPELPVAMTATTFGADIQPQLTALRIPVPRQIHSLFSESRSSVTPQTVVQTTALSRYSGNERMRTVSANVNVASPRAVVDGPVHVTTAISRRSRSIPVRAMEKPPLQLLEGHRRTPPMETRAVRETDGEEFVVPEDAAGTTSPGVPATDAASSQNAAEMTQP